ncbi:single-stranded DNA-binding protein [Oscillospiraceae bacterium CM]|nr:single-stranded DNA-binding protein [Oscillospiraceae bacterium CM]
MNQVVLMGRLTRDPELRHTQTGTAVSSFSLAVDRGFASKDGGERQTDFIDIVAWRNTAEFVSKYFVKGQMAAVTGRLQIRDWTDKDGNKRRSAEVIADNIYFTDSKKSRENSGFNVPEQKSDFSGGYQTPVTGSDFAELTDDDGDLPF